MMAASTVPYEASRDVTIVWEETADCLSLAASMCRISQAYMKEMTFNLEAMEKSLEQSFSNTTEITDTLVREGGLPFRHAHKIVGGAVAELLNQGKGPKDLTYELLNRWSLAICGVNLPIDNNSLEQAAQNRTSVARRTSVGGTAPAEVRRIVKIQQARGKELELLLHQLYSRWESAETELQIACKSL